MTALVFRLSITNLIMENLGKPRKVRINVRRLREFHEETVFFIKSFFFVYMGVVGLSRGDKFSWVSLS